MSPLRSVTLIFVLLYACSSIQSAQGLKCYVCFNCAFPGHLGDTPQLQDCPPAKPEETIGCFTETLYVANDVNKPDDVKRKCKSVKVDPAKKQELSKCSEINQTGKQRASTSCFCETDGCNQNGCSCDRGGSGGGGGTGGGGGAKSRGSNIGVFSLWPLLAALNLLLIHLEMGSSSA